MKITTPSKKPQSRTHSYGDLRYFPRWNVRKRIVFRVYGDSRVHEAHSSDLNCTGMSFVSHIALAPQTLMKVRIYFTQHKSIELQGRLAWSKETTNGHLVGINFIDVDLETQKIILQYAFEVKKEDLSKPWYQDWGKK